MIRRSNDKKEKKKERKKETNDRDATASERDGGASPRRRRKKEKKNEARMKQPATPKKQRVSRYRDVSNDESTRSLFRFFSPTNRNISSVINVFVVSKRRTKTFHALPLLRVVLSIFRIRFGQIRLTTDEEGSTL